MSNSDFIPGDSDEDSQPTSISLSSIKEIDNTLRFFNLEVTNVNRERILKLSQKRGQEDER